MHRTVWQEAISELLHPLTPFVIKQYIWNGVLLCAPGGGVLAGRIMLLYLNTNKETKHQDATMRHWRFSWGQRCPCRNSDVFPLMCCIIYAPPALPSLPADSWTYQVHSCPPPLAPAEITTGTSGSLPVHPVWNAVRSSEGSFLPASPRKRKSPPPILFFLWTLIKWDICNNYSTLPLDLHPGELDWSHCRIHLSPTCGRSKALCFSCRGGGCFASSLFGLKCLDWTLVSFLTPVGKMKKREEDIRNGECFYLHSCFNQSDIGFALF